MLGVGYGTVDLNAVYAIPVDDLRHSGVAPREICVDDFDERSRLKLGSWPPCTISTGRERRRFIVVTYAPMSDPGSSSSSGPS